MKKAIALLLVLCLVLGTLVGCTNNAATEPEDTQQAEQQNQQASDNKTEESAPEDSSDTESPTEINLMVYAPENFDPATFPSVKAIEEACNVKLNYEVPPMSSYEEKLQITMASGEYPDLIMFPSHDSQVFKDAVSDGIVVPLNEYLKSAENLNKYISDVSWDCMKIEGDDQIYGIPRSTPFRCDQYYVRKDWCDNLGIELPEDGIITRDQFVDIMTRFTFDDPDGNGVDDTYGFTWYADGNGNLDPQVFAPGFGLLGWQKSNGTYEYMKAIYDCESDTYTELLSFAADCWKKGIIDPNAPLNKSSAEALTRMLEGSVGMVKDFAGNLPAQLKNLQEVNPDADLTYLFVKNDDGEVKGDAYGGGYWFLNAITVAAEGKEQAIVDMLDYLLSDDGWRLLQYGPENVTWHYEGDEIVVDREAYDELIAPVRNNFTPVRRADDANFFLPVYYDEDQAALIDSCREWVQKAIDTAVPSMDSGYVPKAADDPSFIDYNDKLLNTVTKVILGNATVDDYKQALDDWYNNGGIAYLEEMNTWIASK